MATDSISTLLDHQEDRPRWTRRTVLRLGGAAALGTVAGAA
jgi:hypothetical protein